MSAAANTYYYEVVIICKQTFVRSFVRSLGVIDKIELGFNFGNEKEEN